MLNTLTIITSLARSHCHAPTHNSKGAVNPWTGTHVTCWVVLQVTSSYPKHFQNKESQMVPARVELQKKETLKLKLSVFFSRGLALLNKKISLGLAEVR